MFGRAAPPRSEVASLRVAMTSTRERPAPTAGHRRGRSRPPRLDLRVLAWARGRWVEPVAAADEVYAIALVGHLAIGRTGGWTIVGWHEIVRGGWGPDTGHLTWTDTWGQDRVLALVNPGHLPALFRERVDATVLIEDKIGLQQGAVIVSAHRRLDDPDAPPVWRTTVLDPATPPSPDIMAAAQERLRELRQDLP